MNYVIKNNPQGTDAWLKDRIGHATASHAQAIGNNGKGLETYILEIMSEYLSSGEKEHYSNEHTERGNELEPTARSMYELENDCKVEQIGFCELNDFIGCSPDGLVGEEGMIEIKCPEDKVYFDIIMNEKIDSGYIWQCQMNMLILKRKWCDLIFYNPNFEKSMKVFRLVPDKMKQQALMKGFVIAEKRIKDLKKKYKSL
jgi:putative phage-type endonuclease